nr:alanine aminotransferase 1-like [Danaus plexippus plexippus]
MTSGSVGSYSPAPGLLLIRKHVAQYLTARDGVAANFNNIYLGSGASDLIKSVLTLFVEKVDGKPPGVMIPIPQYPLFSGTLSELGLQQVDYYLDEDDGWVLKYEELERSWRAASEHCSVRAIVVINPGNPTGQVLSRDNIEDIIRFAYKHNLFIVADEVYQENIISKPFHSFKKVMHEMGDPFKKLQLSSFMTCSKGWAAECGLRAGVLELVSLEPRVISALEAARSTQQCASVLGQCVVDCVGPVADKKCGTKRLLSLQRSLAHGALRGFKTVLVLIAYDKQNHTEASNSFIQLSDSHTTNTRSEIKLRSRTFSQNFTLAPPTLLPTGANSRIVHSKRPTSLLAEVATPSVRNSSFTAVALSSKLNFSPFSQGLRVGFF